MTALRAFTVTLDRGRPTCRRPILPARDPNPDRAPLRTASSLPTPATMTSVIDETLHIQAGSVLT